MSSNINEERVKEFLNKGISNPYEIAKETGLSAICVHRTIKKIRLAEQNKKRKKQSICGKAFEASMFAFDLKEGDKIKAKDIEGNNATYEVDKIYPYIFTCHKVVAKGKYSEERSFMKTQLHTGEVKKC